MLTLFTLLFTTFVLTIVPKLGYSVEISPLFEKTALTRSFTDQRYLYVFDFDFVNTLQQSIEILSVNVFDVNGRRLEQDWVASGRNWDPRLMTHALSGDHPLVKIISKPRGTPLEQATVTPVGDRIEITVTNRVLSGGEGIRPSLYLLSSKDQYDFLVLRVAYRLNGNLQAVSRTFTVGRREEERAQALPTPSGETSIVRKAPYDFNTENNDLVNCNHSTAVGDRSRATVLSDPKTGALDSSIIAQVFLLLNVTSGSAVGQAGVGIKYVAPKNGIVTISTHVSISGYDHAQLLRVNIPKTEGITSAFMPKVPTGLVTLESDVRLQVYRFSPRRDDDNRVSFRPPIFLGDPVKISPSLQDIIAGILKAGLPVSPENEDRKYDSSKAYPASLQLAVDAGDTLYVCAGIWSKATATGIGPNEATTNYEAKVQDISISYK